MNIFQILARLLAPKKKKAIVKPVVVYTPPPTSVVDPITGEIIKVVDPNILEFNKQIDLIKSKFSYLKYLDIGKNSLLIPNYNKSENSVKDFLNAVSPVYRLLKDVKLDDALKVLIPVYGLTSYLQDKFGPGDNGKDIPGGIYFNYKFFKGNEYFGAQEPFKEKCSLGYFKGTWKNEIESESGFSYETVQKYFILFYPYIRSGFFATQKQFYDEIKKIEGLIDNGRRNYTDSLSAAIYEIKICAKKAKDCYEIEKNYNEKIRMRNDFYTLKNLINANYNNSLSNEAYTWILPQKPKDLTPADVMPDIGPGAVQTGPVVTGPVTTGPSIADLNTTPNQIGTIYPQWENKSYLTSEYVIYNGLTYKNAAQIVGNNNNTPNKDTRWQRI